MRYPLIPIAKYTFIEAIRNRLIYLTLIGLFCAFGLAEFTSELAITESDEFVVVILASLLRIFCVFIIGLFIITSVVREFNDKGFEYVMSLPLPRYAYYFGKLLGFCCLSLVIALGVTLLLCLYSNMANVLTWYLSLVMELFIVVALSLLCLFTFKQVTVAFSTVMAFYLLARSMATIQLISDSPILQAYTLSQKFISLILDIIDYLLPNLDTFSQSSWLIYQAGSGSELLMNLLQTVIYMMLLSACALFDLYRMEL